MTTKQARLIADANLGIFVAQVVAAAKDGWEIDGEPALLGYLYEVPMKRDASAEQLDKDANPPLTRAEIAAKARAAKAAKALKKLEAGETLATEDMLTADEIATDGLTATSIQSGTISLEVIGPKDE